MKWKTKRSISSGDPFCFFFTNLYPTLYFAHLRRSHRLCFDVIDSYFLTSSLICHQFMTLFEHFISLSQIYFILQITYMISVIRFIVSPIYGIISYSVFVCYHVHCMILPVHFMASLTWCHHFIVNYLFILFQQLILLCNQHTSWYH